MTQQEVVPVATDVPELATFARTVQSLVARGLDERALTAAVQAELTAVLAAGCGSPRTRPGPTPSAT